MSGWQRARDAFRWQDSPLARGDQQGEHHCFYPLDLLDRAFPLRLPLAPLLRALVAEDHRAAASFGALELEEEDLALAAYLCPAGLEYGPLLRRALDRLEETLP
jgi:Na+-transporting NADH:ubiquinone oxidoreductase subunit A